MGFDLYGENPVMREINEDAYPVYDKYTGMDFKKQMKAFKKDNKLEKQYLYYWRNWWYRDFKKFLKDYNMQDDNQYFTL